MSVQLRSMSESTTLRKGSREEGLSALLYWFAIAAQPLMGIVFWSRTWDDSAITLGFARTFAMGGKIEPTIGSGIVEGYSTTLWMLLMAAAAKISSNPQLLLGVAKVSDKQNRNSIVDIGFVDCGIDEPGTLVIRLILPAFVSRSA